MKPRPSHALVLLLLASGAPALAQSEACFLFPGNAEEHTCTCGPDAFADRLVAEGLLSAQEAR